MTSKLSTLFVLTGNSGSWDMERQWFVLAYETRDAAEHHRVLAERAYAEARREKYIALYGDDSDHIQRRHSVLVTEPTAYDPYLIDVDGVGYRVMEIPARLGPAPSFDDIKDLQYAVPPSMLAVTNTPVANTLLADKLRAALK